MKKIKAIISGGGTGGHIFPALSIAGKLMEMNPENEILFVGANGRMEMEKVPAAGYPIIGLDIQGFQRKNLLKNLTLPYKLWKSLRKSRQIIREFQPDIAIGVGGYASAALLMAATQMKIPTLIQEQNGFAGLTNKLLGKKADKICVAYEGMDRFFPADKIIFTGNPIRSDMIPATPESRQEACEYYGLSPEKKKILIVGGSLGSRTLNEAVLAWLEEGCQGNEEVEILWQCGKFYKNEIEQKMQQYEDMPWRKFIHFTDFIGRMDLAYAMADVVISRSGACSVSEICACAKASILVPSPNVTEDHQTFNAMALVKNGAAQIIRDNEAVEKLMRAALGLVNQDEKIKDMERNALLLARPDAAQTIAQEAYKLMEKK
ncbi:MAG: undecaprenyldiphospho-muramoylpentapeptide beta-N-acetylglucosaminyltransferase [Bacteroidales bacterium]|nr:undecaprenyldiphospho-muramoylpentapeptide beta-N-acetylglucosaminyltransferase [Bacteroidales bacterium]